MDLCSELFSCRAAGHTAVIRTFSLFPGPNAISVSLSPMGCYVMVGLASRRILLHPTTDHMVAQVFRLQQPHGGETSIRVRQFPLTFAASHRPALSRTLILSVMLLFRGFIY